MSVCFYPSTSTGTVQVVDHSTVATATALLYSGVPQKKRIGFESNLNKSIFYRIGRTRINLEQIQCHIGTETGRFFFLLKKVLGFGAEERLLNMENGLK